MVPQDGAMLLSYLNTKLRDDYASLEELCEELELSQEEIEDKLGALGYFYDAESNRFC